MGRWILNVIANILIQIITLEQRNVGLAVVGVNWGLIAHGRASVGINT